MMKLIDATRLLWVTPEAERLIVKTARVSAPQNEDNLATGPRLLKYLINTSTGHHLRWQTCA